MQRQQTPEGFAVCGLCGRGLRAGRWCYLQRLQRRPARSYLRAWSLVVAAAAVVVVVVAVAVAVAVVVVAVAVAVAVVVAVAGGVVWKMAAAVEDRWETCCGGSWRSWRCWCWGGG